MIRRRTVVLASAGTLLGLFALLMVALAVLTRTEFGRARIRALVLRELLGAVHGTLYLGTIRGSLLTNVIIDSAEIRGTDDSLFVRTGPIAVDFDPRDLFDQRIVLTRVTLANPTVHIWIDSSGNSNFRKIFPAGPATSPPTIGHWGAYIALHNVRLTNLTVQVTEPWHPDDSLHGARRDSAVAYSLKRTDKEIRRVPGGFVKVLHWANAGLTVDSARLDDRGPGGRAIHIASLDANESDPPFRFRNVRGTVLLKADSLWLDLPHFDLPGSTGTAKGKVWWGGGVPVRYDVTVVGDSVTLGDVAWVYPTLPTEGHGRMTLLMRSQKNPAVVDYVLRNMDVRTTASRLRGTMTFGVGAPITILKDVNIDADPVDFRLIEVLSGEPLPYPFRGTLTGTVRGAGGPLNRFRVDSADVVYRDANVPGAVTYARGNGLLNILKPSETVFLGFHLTLSQLDLRTLQYLNATFPHLDGLVSGRATLDSSLLDLRFRDADITHSYGPGPPSHVTGAGRVTFGDTLRYDVALNVSPLSFASFGPAYQTSRIPLTGEYDGPIRLEGSLPDFSLNTELRGTAGMLAYDGRVDADSVGGYGFDGTLRVAGLNLRTLLDTALTPNTVLTGSATLRLTGDSLATLNGSATIEMERSLFDSIRVFPTSRARLRFANRKVFVDTLFAETVAATLAASGALGLDRSTGDSLQFSVSADSLGGFRRQLGALPAVPGAQPGAVVDSLRGIITGRGFLKGSIDSLAMLATIDATGVSAMGVVARDVRAGVDLRNLTTAPVGSLDVSGEALNVSGVALTDAGITVHLADSLSGDFSLLASAANGPSLTTAGDLAFAADTTTVRIRSLDLTMQDHGFTLERPASVRVEPHRIVIDTLVLESQRAERITVSGSLPDSGEMAVLLRVDSMHLRDLADLAQARVPLGGTLTGEVEVSGTRQAPQLQLAARVLGAEVGDVKLPRISVNGHYENERLLGGVLLAEQDTVVAEVAYNLPIDRRGRMRDDTLRVRVASRDVDLRVLESFTSSVRNAVGKFTANLDVTGRGDSTALSGLVTVTGGALTLPTAGVRLRDITVVVRAVQDTVYVDRFSIVSGDSPSNVFRVAGYVTNPLNIIAPSADRDPAFDLTLTANDFHAVANKHLADLNISTEPPLHLVGRVSGSQLTGTVIVNSGSLNMPESSDKQLISLSRDDLKSLGLDTLALARLNILPEPPPTVVKNLTISNVDVVIGPDVWLRSAGSGDVNIKLGGSVRVTKARAVTGTGPPQLGLEGTLQTERGRYVLNLGLVQRSFDIEQGQLRFFGTPEFNPALDISALYTERLASSTYGGRSTIRIRVKIQGTLDSPQLTLQSADSLQLSQSDMISYLVFRTPSFDVGGGLRQNYSQLSAVVLGSAVNALSSRLSGGLFDYVEVQTAADRLRLGNAQQTSAGGYFSGAQLGIGKQLNDRTFLSLTAGVCQLGQLNPLSSQKLDPGSLAQAIGAKVEYQIDPSIGLGVSASVEPSLSALLCSQGIERGFSTSVRQLGFDLFRVFRY